MKKSLKMLLALVATVSLVGCSSKNESNDAQPTDTPTSTEVSTETNVEVAEIDVDNLSAVEIYDYVVENAGELFSIEMPEGNPEVKPIKSDTVVSFAIESSDRLASTRYLEMLSPEYVNDLYAIGLSDGKSFEETGINKGASIIVVKAEDGKIDNLVENMNTLYDEFWNDEQEQIDFWVDGGFADGLKDQIEDTEKYRDNSGYVVINNTIIACCATNGMDILNSLFDNVQPMFSGR